MRAGLWSFVYDSEEYLSRSERRLRRLRMKRRSFQTRKEPRAFVDDEDTDEEEALRFIRRDRNSY